MKKLARKVGGQKKKKKKGKNKEKNVLIFFGRPFQGKAAQEDAFGKR